MPVSLKRVYYMYLLHIINDISMYNDIKRKIVISSGWTVYNVITMAVSSRTQRKLRLSFDRCQGNLLTLCAKSRNFEKIEFKSMNLCSLFLSVCYWFVIGFRGGGYTESANFNVSWPNFSHIIMAIEYFFSLKNIFDYFLIPLQLRWQMYAYGIIWKRYNYTW